MYEVAKAFSVQAIVIAMSEHANVLLAAKGPCVSSALQALHVATSPGS